MSLISNHHCMERDFHYESAVSTHHRQHLFTTHSRLESDPLLHPAEISIAYWFSVTLHSIISDTIDEIHIVSLCRSSKSQNLLDLALILGNGSFGDRHLHLLLPYLLLQSSELHLQRNEYLFSLRLLLLNFHFISVNIKAWYYLKCNSYGTTQSPTYFLHSSSHRCSSIVIMPTSSWM